MAVCVPSSRFEPQVDDLCASVVDAAAWASESLRHARRTVLARVPDRGAVPMAIVPSAVGADG
jgi:hypothetical protein